MIMSVLLIILVCIILGVFLLLLSIPISDYRVRVVQRQDGLFIIQESFIFFNWSRYGVIAYHDLDLAKLAGEAIYNKKLEQDKLRKGCKKTKVVAYWPSKKD